MVPRLPEHPVEHAARVHVDAAAVLAEVPEHHAYAHRITPPARVNLTMVRVLPPPRRPLAAPHVIRHLPDDVVDPVTRLPIDELPRARQVRDALEHVVEALAIGFLVGDVA